MLQNLNQKNLTLLTANFMSQSLIRHLDTASRYRFTLICFQWYHVKPDVEAIGTSLDTYQIVRKIFLLVDAKSHKGVKWGNGVGAGGVTAFMIVVSHQNDVLLIWRLPKCLFWPLMSILLCAAYPHKKNTKCCFIVSVKCHSPPNTAQIRTICKLHINRAMLCRLNQFQIRPQ